MHIYFVSKTAALKGPQFCIILAPFHKLVARLFNQKVSLLLFVLWKPHIGFIKPASASAPKQFAISAIREKFFG
jgi:hypothetical protein